MSDKTSETSGAGHDEGGAARRPDVGDQGENQEQSRKTGAGQEAQRGARPGDHDHEHQSNYGGGGVNGGADGGKSGER